MPCHCPTSPRDVVEAGLNEAAGQLRSRALSVIGGRTMRHGDVGAIIAVAALR